MDSAELQSAHPPASEHKAMTPPKLAFTHELPCDGEASLTPHPQL
jgi:hypothetical protein